ncbi:MAG: ornithine racemase Orr [Clostridiales bacterium]|nr:ornithine racemase Orr [Clostridiales bacterium]MDD7036099.1 ornithine racemase Orr [Bacillota bacterium]
MYPKLVYNMDKLKANVDAAARITREDGGCSMMCVTKCVCADRKICEMLTAHPSVDFLADSRVDNIRKYADLIEASDKQSVLLRLPMMCEIEDLVKYVDISQNSELATIEAINEEAGRQGKVHKILLMVDLGDLREGIFFRDEEKILAAAEVIEAMSNVELYGLSTNLTCYGAIIPKNDNLSVLCDIAGKVEERLGRKLDVVSGGNSSSIYLIWKGDMPEKINNLRLGESILLGNDTAYGETVPGAVHDAMTLQAQIIELQEKPSLPIGEVGKDAFGNVPEYEDRGIIKRAILAVGKQDVDIDGLAPLDEQIDILGGSSDHMLLDVTGCDREYKVGDVVEFTLEYGALLKAATSEYVKKEYV